MTHCYKYLEPVLLLLFCYRFFNIFLKENYNSNQSLRHLTHSTKLLITPLNIKYEHSIFRLLSSCLFSLLFFSLSPSHLITPSLPSTTFVINIKHQLREAPHTMKDGGNVMQRYELMISSTRYTCSRQPTFEKRE